MRISFIISVLIIAVQIQALAQKTNMSYTYLGCGGIIIDPGPGKPTLVAEPFVSNNLGKLGAATALLRLRKLKPDTSYINQVLDVSIREKLSRSSIVWVSHGHYDHLLDLPYIYRKFMQHNPTVLVSKGVKQGVSKLFPVDKLLAVEEDKAITIQQWKAQHNQQSGYWVIYPLLHGHAPTALGITVWPKMESKPIPSFEKYLSGTIGSSWHMGQNLAWVADWVEVDTVAFRIYYQSSSYEGGPRVLPAYIQPRKVDLAILGVASHDHTPNYPQLVLQSLNPEKVIGIHWESFFTQQYQQDPVKQVKSKTKEQFAEKAQREVSFPLPFSSFNLR